MATDRQDLLRIMCGLHGRFNTARATVREWHDLETVSKLLKRFRASDLYRETFGQQEPRGFKGPSLGSFDRIRKVWYERPNRWRQEIERADGKGTEYKVVDSKAFWFYSPLDEARRATLTEGEFGPDFEVAHIFEPCSIKPLLEELDIQTVEQVRQAGRPAFRVEATVRGEWTCIPEPLWWGADDYELVVDAEHGAILSLSSRFDGLNFDVTEVLEIGFNEAFDKNVFVLDLPGVEFGTVDRL